MIRKQTWILLVVFVGLLGLAFYLQENPISGNSASLTPSPTAAAQMVEGWQSGDIVWMELSGGQEGVVQVWQDDQGTWLVGPDDPQSISVGKAEELRTQIADTRTLAFLDPGYDLASIGLGSPAYVLAIRNAQGKETEIRIGNLTPTESGYYIVVDNGSPAVASKFAIDAILDLMKKERLIDPTATPPAATEEPATEKP